MSSGTTAAQLLLVAPAGAPGPVTIVGGTASNSGQETDLATDAGGDLLGVDAGGDVLLVQAGFIWVGTTAALLVPERREALEGEGWTGLSTETGSTIGTEGS